MAYSDWMSQLPDSLKQRPLSEIAIPGTHDSATSDINMESRDGPDLDGVKKLFEKCACCIGKKIIVNWCKNQILSLAGQMNLGIRYLDLRLAYDVNTSDFYFTHGLLSTLVCDALTEIRDFLNAHPGEVLLLDLNHFHAMDGHHGTVGEMILRFLSHYLYPMPSENPTIPSLQQCVESDKRILLFYHFSVPNMPYWLSTFIPSPWPQVTSARKLMDILERNYADGRSENSFYVTQVVLTPTISYVARHVTSTVRSLPNKAVPRFIDWVKTKKIGPQGINICICDYFQDFDFVPAILALNQE